jgi:hypothetical protein
VARPAPTTGGVIEMGVGLEKVKKFWFAAMFRGTDL